MELITSEMRKACIHMGDKHLQMWQEMYQPRAHSLAQSSKLERIDESEMP